MELDFRKIQPQQETPSEPLSHNLDDFIEPKSAEIMLSLAAKTERDKEDAIKKVPEELHGIHEETRRIRTITKTVAELAEQQEKDRSASEIRDKRIFRINLVISIAALLIGLVDLLYSFFSP